MYTILNLLICVSIFFLILDSEVGRGHALKKYVFFLLTYFLNPSLWYPFQQKPLKLNYLKCMTFVFAYLSAKIHIKKVVFVSGRTPKREGGKTPETHKKKVSMIKKKKTRTSLKLISMLCSVLVNINQQKNVTKFFC